MWLSTVLELDHKKHSSLLSWYIGGRRGAELGKSVKWGVCSFYLLVLISFLMSLKIEEWLRLECTSAGLVHPTLPKQGHQRWLPRIIFEQGDLTSLPWTSLSNLCQCSITLTVQKSLDIQRKLLCLSLGPLPLVLALDSPAKSLALSSSHHSFRCLYTLMC